MPRRLRTATGGLAYHVINRAVARLAIFEKDADYAAFEKVIQQTHDRMPSRLLAYVLMPNHFHLVLWPRKDGELSEFMRLLTVTHTQRWHANRHTAGTGPLYQGRFKSFPIQQDEHLLTVMRYVERNPLRAGRVERAEDWRWSSAWQNRQSEPAAWLRRATEWPVDRRRDWTAWVNRPQSAKEEAAVRLSVIRGRPFGEQDWVARMAAKLGLDSTLRERGRPRKSPTAK